jgi:hypothetical protein
MQNILDHSFAVRRERKQLAIEFAPERWKFINFGLGQPIQIEILNCSLVISIEFFDE